MTNKGSSISFQTKTKMRKLRTTPNPFNISAGVNPSKINRKAQLEILGENDPILTKNTKQVIPEKGKCKTKKLEKVSGK